MAIKLMEHTQKDVYVEKKEVHKKKSGKVGYSELQRKKLVELLECSDRCPRWFARSYM